MGQVQVSTSGSKVSAVPLLLATLDLRGMVVSGDAIFASRKLSLSILHQIGLFALHGEKKLPHAQRRFAYQLDRALARLAS